MKKWVNPIAMTFSSNSINLSAILIFNTYWSKAHVEKSALSVSVKLGGFSQNNHPV